MRPDNRLALYNVRVWIAAASILLVASWMLSGQASFQMNGAPLTAVSLSTDGQYLAATRANGTVIVCRTDSKKTIIEVRLGGQRGSESKAIAFADSDRVVVTSDWLVHDVAFAPGGKAQTSVWSIPNGTLKQRLASVGGSAAMAASIGGQRVAVASGQEVDIIETSPVRKSVTLKGSGFDVDGLAWSPDGKLVAAVGLARWSIWDITTGKVLVNSATALPNMVSAVAFTPDGKYVVLFGNDDDQIRYCDPATGDEVSRITWEKGFRELSIDVSSGLLVSCGQNKPGVVIRDLTNGHELGRLGPTTLYGHVAVSENGKLIVGVRAGSESIEGVDVWHFDPELKRPR